MRDTVKKVEVGIQYQFTMFSEKHKPIATTVYAESRQDFVFRKKPFRDALIKICTKRGWSMKDLEDNGYGKWKVRKLEVTD
ncbi:MAG: hypothetical protein AABY22_06210 [Nanoarchaeota archaeon]